jgi:PAS domain S-box-containing protein
MTMTPPLLPLAGGAASLEEARLTAERYRLLFESNPVPMWAYDKTTLGFLAVNDAAIRSYGYTHDEFLAMTLDDVRPREDVSRFNETSHSLPAGYHQTGEWRHRRKDGSVFPVETTSHSVDFGGRPARELAARPAPRGARRHLGLRERGAGADPWL